MTMTLGAYLQTVLWVHEEVPSDVVKHNGVLPVVKFSILPPYHTQGLHLDTCKSSNTLNQCNHLLTKQQTSGNNSMKRHVTSACVCGLFSNRSITTPVSRHMQSHLQLWRAPEYKPARKALHISLFTLHRKRLSPLTELDAMLAKHGAVYQPYTGVTSQVNNKK